MAVKRPGDRRAGRWRGRWTFASTALIAALPIVAGVDLRLRHANAPVPELASLVAQGEAQAIAMRRQAARGITGERFVGQTISLFDSIQSTAAYGARVNELRRQADAFYRDSHGIPYLQGTDPYRWLRRARNIVEHGRFGETEREGRSWNDLTGVPLGVPADGNAQALATGIAARVLRPLGGPSLEAIHYWSPLVVVCIALLVAALFGKSLAGPWGGLLGAMVLALQGSVAERTTAGYADTDSWNLAFALAMAWLLWESLGTRSTRRAVVTGAFAALVVGAFAWSWPGWWFVFASLVAGLGAAIALAFASPWAARALRPASVPQRATRRAAGKGNVSAPAPTFEGAKLGRSFALRGAIFVVAGAAGVILFAGPSRLAGFRREPLAALRMHAATVGDAWPNVYATVGELQPRSLEEIRRGVGGDPLVALAIAGLFRLVAGPLRTRHLVGVAIAGLAVVTLGSHARPDTGFAILVAATVIAAAGGVVVALRRGRIVHAVPLGLAAWVLMALVACSRGNRFVFLLAPPLAIASGTLLGDLVSRAVAAARPVGWRAAVPIATIAAIVVLLGTVRAHAKQALSGLVRLPEMNDAWAASFGWLEANSDPRAVVCTWWDYGDMVTAVARRRVLNDAGSQATSVSYWMARVLATEDPNEARDILRMVSVGGQEGYDVLRRAGVPAARAVQLLVEVARLPASQAAVQLTAAGVPESAAREVAGPFSGTAPQAYLWLCEDLTTKTSSWAVCGHWDFGTGASRTPGVEVKPAMICAEGQTGLITQTGVRVDLPAPGWVGMLPGARGSSVAVVRRRGVPRLVTLPASIARSLYVRLMYENPRGLGPFDLAWEGQTFLGERVAVYRIRW